jgi:hypothetical protein
VRSASQKVNADVPDRVRSTPDFIWDSSFFSIYFKGLSIHNGAKRLYNLISIKGNYSKTTKGSVEPTPYNGGVLHGGIHHYRARKGKEQL